MKPTAIFRPLCVIGGVFFFGLFFFPLTRGVFHIGNTTGMVCALLLFLVGVFFEEIKKAVSFLKKTAAGRFFIGGFVGVLSLLAVTVVILTAGMIYGANLPAKGGETVIVLGCKVNGETPSLMLSRRLDTAAEYLLQTPGTVCIVSGGQGAGEKVSEAAAMKEYLIRKGVSGEMILLEDRSADTHENLSFSREMLEEQGLGENVLIVSDGFHLWRASIIAKEQGLSPASLSAKTPWYLLPCYYVRELYGLLEEIFLK